MLWEGRLLPRDLLKRWYKLSDYQSLLDGMRHRNDAHLVYGLVPGTDAYLEAALFQDLNRSMLVVCEGMKEAVRIHQDLCAWHGAKKVFLFPPLDLVPQPETARSHEWVGARLRVFGQLFSKEPSLVVATVRALERALPPPQLLKDCFIHLKRGEQSDFQRLLRTLGALGYTREDAVVKPGQFAVRGGILDVYAPIWDDPIRLEFFGDHIDSARIFDADSQRSLENIESILLSPATETFPGLKTVSNQAAVDAMRRELAHQVRQLERQGHTQSAVRLAERVKRQIEGLEGEIHYPNTDLFFPYWVPQRVTFFDYLPSESPIIMWHPEALERGRRGRQREVTERHQRWLEEGVVLPGQLAVECPPEATAWPPMNHPRLYLTDLLKGVTESKIESFLRVSSRNTEVFYGQMELVRGEFSRWEEQGREVVVTTSTSARKQGLADVFHDEVRVIQASLSQGFDLPALNLILITDDELTGRGRTPSHPLMRRRRRPIRSHDELEAGDYVVHRHHGVGQFLGMTTQEAAGAERDYLMLSYAAGDRLYVPMEAVDLVHKYAGAESDPPRIYRLGSGDWSRLKSQVKASVRDMTRELLQLYAARQALSGYQFGPDTRWQRDFESQFPFEETPDQQAAAENIKAAMQRPHPMDYLLCGDVGYGKTEVALRAAFKAIMAGKQVAFLVPTTILAQQHGETIADRFAGWPIETAVLSRFRTPKEQEAAITGLRRGQIDLVVGTHRLLSDDVAFSDLGLIIIDEEHRFGVGHKERLKQIKSTVDALTLTATPIPRTLYMALSGIREMSVIETPPENRLPVATYVLSYDPPLVQDAIKRELARGGQVFYVHNRVRGIPRTLNRVQALVPWAEVATAHGQMAESQLEQVMQAFVEQEQDVLVCTTIIESGLDLPNVNTLIVEDADRMGLAQLYQLRGRVGRSDRLAYAYLTYRSDEVLSDVAYQRLGALQAFTELGSGFRLAKRDLELRGAGNVLGAQQHGFMMAVGFDLYTRFLEEAVAELKGESLTPKIRPVIELPVDAYLPDDYVPVGSDRIDWYRRLNAADTIEDVREGLDELIDRFGDPPVPAVQLIRLMELRVAAAKRGVIQIAKDKTEVTLESVSPEALGMDWQALGAKYRLRTRVWPGESRCRVRFRGEWPAQPEALLLRLREIVEAIQTFTGDSPS